MPTFTQDPETGDLNARRYRDEVGSTESSMSAVEYTVNKFEHTLVFNRRNGQEVNMSVSHFQDHYEVTLAVFNTEQGELTMIHEQVNLSYQECKLLRDLLNRREISAILDRGGKE